MVKVLHFTARYLASWLQTHAVIPEQGYPAWLIPLLLLSILLSLLALALSVCANLAHKDDRWRAPAGGATSQLLASVQRQRSADLESNDEAFYSLSSEGEGEKAKPPQPECIAAMIRAFRRNGCQLTSNPRSVARFTIDVAGLTSDEVYKELLRNDEGGVLQLLFANKGVSKKVQPDWEPCDGGMLRWTTFHMPLWPMPFAPPSVNPHTVFYLRHDKKERRVVMREMTRPLEMIYGTTIELQGMRVFQEVPGGPGEGNKVEVELFVGVFYHDSCIIWPIVEAQARHELTTFTKELVDIFTEVLGPGRRPAVQ